MNRTIAQNIIDKLIAGKAAKLRMSQYGGLSDKSFSALDCVIRETFNNAHRVRFEYTPIPETNKRKAKITVSTKDYNILFETDLITLFKV